MCVLFFGVGFARSLCLCWNLEDEMLIVACFQVVKIDYCGEHLDF